MTKEVLVTISGMHTGLDADTGEMEPVEVVTPGTYYLKNGKHYILFEEMVEGVPGSIKNTMKITDNRIFEIHKTGLTNARMEFEKDRITMSSYQTPFGEMRISIQTRDINIDIQEDFINVEIFYKLDVNEAPLSDCEIKVNVKSINKK